MKLLVVGNPVSGGGKARPLIAELESLLENGGHQVEVFWTSARGDALARIQALEPDFDALVVVGGDGTLNEAINGMVLPARIPIAFMPAGTGNVIAHELGMPRDPRVVVQAIEGGRIRRLDMGFIGERRFLMLASAGFDALVTREVLGFRKGTLRRHNYAIPILRAMLRYRPPRLQVTVDGGAPLEGALVIVNKTPHYGGIITVAHKARCDSGHFDVCVFRRGSILALSRYFLAGLRNTLERKEGVTYLTGRHIEITADEEVPVQVDGDYYSTTPVTIDLEPAVLPMFVPPRKG
jgi:diacylglycerol kinase (ATP)